MIRSITFWMLSTLLITGPVVFGHAQDQPPLSQLEERAFKQAVAFVEPSVVRIQTVGGLDRVGNLLTNTGPTTGVVVTEDGYIISSAFNFISKPASILVEFADGRRFPAREIATDHLLKLTLLKIEAESLKPAIAAEEESLKVGQWAIAVGRTYDPKIPSLSVGIISALDRIWGRAIQTDAKISPVNYGGPLIDLEGRVQGILVPLSISAKETTAGVEWYDSGIGFAIPMEDVYAILERLKMGEDLKQGLMGVSFRRNDLEEGELTVDMVRPDSPAYRAGMRAKDVIMEINGQLINRVGHLRYALGTSYAGDTVRVKFRKGEEIREADMELVAQLIPYEAGFLGILPKRPPVTEVKDGVEIRYLYVDGPAEKAGLQKGDKIVKVQEEAITDDDSLWTAISSERPGEKVVVVYERDGKSKPVEIELGQTDEEIPYDLTDSFIPVPEDKEKAQKNLATGLINVEMEAHHHTYWGYVPEDYNPAHEYGLVVWLHPSGDTMEASIAQQWQTFCETRGLILIGPKAEKLGGWNLNETEFVHDAVLDVSAKYNIDPNRVVLHSFGSGGPFAYHLAFKYREMFRALAIVADPLRVRPPDNDPEYRLQFLLVCGTEDEQMKPVEATVNGLQQLKYPVSLIKIEGRDHRYPATSDLQEVLRWIDALDRI